MKRKAEIILQHGWGFDKSCWRGWMPHLRENQDLESSIQTPDRGYFGESKPVYLFDQSSSLKIVIAHSLGLHFLPEDILKSADLIVLASSFSHFHGGSLLEQKRSRKTISLMLDRLEIAPTELLNEFYTNCYHPLLTSQMLLMGNIQRQDLDLLSEDLELLNSSTFDLGTIAKVPRILLVHGSEDNIVDQVHSTLMQEQLPNSSLTLFEGAGHSLPLTHVAPVWISLRNVIRHLAAVNA